MADAWRKKEIKKLVIAQSEVTVKRQRRVAANDGIATVRDMILEALDGAGGVDYLKRQAEENPRAFLSLLTKVIPPQGPSRNDETVVQVVRWANSDEEATPDPARR